MRLQSLKLLGELRDRLSAEGSFHVRLLISSGAAICAIAGLAAIFALMAVHDYRMDKLRAHTLEVVRLTGKADNYLSILENAHRGFLLTGEDSYLTSFESDRHALEECLNALEARIGSDQRQRSRIWAARRLRDQWLQNFVNPEIAARRLNNTAGQKFTVETPGHFVLNKAHIELQSLQQDAQNSLSTQGADRHWVNLSFQEFLSFQELMYLPQFQNAVAQMEKYERAFLLTSDSHTLTGYSAAAGEYNTLYDHLLVLLGSDTQRLEALKKINAGVRRWQNEVAAREMESKTRGENVATLAARDQGKQLMDVLRADLENFEKQETENYRKVSRNCEISRIMHAAGLSALCLFAIGVLLASGIYSFRVYYHRHLTKIETAEARTRAIIETSLDGIVTMDQQGIVQSINPAAEKMFGIEAKAIVRQSISKIIPQRLFLHDLVQTGRGTIMAMGCRQGYYQFPIEISLSETDIGGARQFVALIRDVTERKRSEETLKHIGLGVSDRTGEEFVRSLVQELSKALETEYSFIVETVVRGDNTVCSLAIVENGQIRRKANVDLTNTACEEVLKRGFRAYSRAVREKFPFDEILKELKAESFVASPLTDHKGKTIGLMGVIDRKPMENLQIVESTLQIFAARAGAEIERKRFEQDLAEEKERLAVTLRSIGDGFITIDADGKVVLMNAVAEKLTGWPGEAALGLPLHEVFRILNERTRKPCQETLRRIIDAGSITATQGHTLLVSREGGERVIETTAAPIRDKQNRKNGVVLVFRDITEKQRIEEERRKAEKLESLGVAAGGIAHDFNNLLTAIIGNVSLTLLSLEDEELCARLTAAKKASLRAQELAAQLLTFAKGGAPVKKTASIAQLVRDTVTFTLSGSRIQAQFQIPEELWAVEIDPSQMSQVIGNMTTNAEQAMPAGGTLRVRCENVQVGENAPPELSSLQPGCYVRISLCDEGVGIAGEHLKKIFDPYFSTKAKASGLGLATSYSIVKNHDGLITVDSQPGSGSTFFIYLPASSRPAAAAHQKRGGEAPAKKGGRVLVVDDEEEIRALVNFALTPLGYEVVEAPDAATAIALYTEALASGKKFDVVMMDLTIPGGMGGAEAIKKLRALDPEIRAIVSSGYATDPIMSRHRDYGFCGMLAKPYEVATLVHVVNEVANGYFDGEEIAPAMASVAIV